MSGENTLLGSLINTIDQHQQLINGFDKDGILEEDDGDTYESSQENSK